MHLLRNLTEKRGYSQIAGSERSGESDIHGNYASISPEFPPSSEGVQQEDRPSSRPGSQFISEQPANTSGSSPTSGSPTGTSGRTQEASPRSSSSTESSASGSSSSDDDSQDASSLTPLLRSSQEEPHAKAKPKAKAKGKGKAKSKAKPKVRFDSHPDVTEVDSPFQALASGIHMRSVLLCLSGAALLVLIGVLVLSWCALSPWSSWVCLPALEESDCGPGVRKREREVTHGVCPGSSLVEMEPCHIECRVPDYIAEAKARGLPCNMRMRSHLLKEAEEVFGAEDWAALRSCERAYLCCHACEHEYQAKGPLSCGGHDVEPRTLHNGQGCLSCFAAGPGPGCKNGEVTCRRSFVSTAGTGHLCCLALQLRLQQPLAEQPTARQRAPPLDTENFKRRPDTSAFLGVLQDPYDWPEVLGEGACQKLCWREDDCQLYVYVSRDSGIRAWHDRCVTWDMGTAKKHARASMGSWIQERGAFSGLKVHVSYSDVIVTVRSAPGLESGSVGPFQLYVCKDSRRRMACQVDSPISLTSTSCTAGEDCLSAGTTSHFVGTVVVPESFVLRGVRIEGQTEDAWVIEEIAVDCEGQVGRHAGRASVTASKPWVLAVGCITVPGWHSTAEPGTPCLSRCYNGYGPFGWCWVDATASSWGSCSPQCQGKHNGGDSGSKQHVGGSMHKSGMSCAELNWPTWSKYNDDHAVCGASNDNPLRGCSGQLSWSAGKEFCELVGARLCTRAELERDEAAGTGCGLDRQQVWSSTPCEHGYMALPGASFHSTVEARCTPPDSTSAQVRCCADARKVTIEFLRKHRDMHKLPWHMQRRTEGGLNNWQVVAGTNHEGKTGFFLQSGMLEDQLPRDSQDIDVSLVDVPIAKLGGEIQFWFRVKSEPGWDRLHFYIDEVEETRGGFPVSGSVKWTFARFSFPARAGSELHSFRWRFSKDRSDTIGNDVACIDEITVFGVLSLD